MAVYATLGPPATDLPVSNAPVYGGEMRYDVLLECDDRPHPRHLATIYANHDDEARRLVAERWLRQEPELRLQIVRVDGDRLTTLTDNTEGMLPTK